MRWRKLGLVYVADAPDGWAQSSAMVPCSLMLDEDRIRVFVAFVDGEQVGRVGYVDVDARDPLRVLGVSPRPVLDVGAPGTFDDHGVTPLTACEHDGRVRLYYAGWQLGVSVRYYLFTGLAESTDRGESFERVSEAPVLDRCDGELHIRTGGHVRRDGDGWRMWYAGGSEWVGEGEGAKPTYALRHVASADGIGWPDGGRVVISPRGEDEIGFGRPAVLPGPDGGLRMYYAVRTLSHGYHMGYAESPDGIDWERRDDEAGIAMSDSGWDSEMIAYPCVQDTRHGQYLFYNGNGYGRTGFGVAIADTATRAA